MEQLNIEQLIKSDEEAKCHLAAFLTFHRDNLGVWEQVKTMCARLRKSGRKRYSITTIIEVIRHHTNLGYSDPDRDFKINNNHRSAYARLYMYHYGVVGDVPFFELRESYFDSLDPQVKESVWQEFAP